MLIVFRMMLFRVLFVLMAMGISWGASPILQTKLGSLKGSIMKSQLGRQFVAFRGIPYAKPPVGDLRFKLPEPMGSWEGVKVASRDGPMCIQPNPLLLGLLLGKEDCLVLNVYMPKVPEEGDKPLPVMFFIHGGGFLIGSGNPLFSGPRKLLDKDIVLVTINYRLGAFGFLSTGDEVSSGNWGLHDQVLALKWVRDNIADYGGNPEEITIFGESAGAVSVQYLMLHPELEGTFKRVIMESGTVLLPRLLTKNPLPKAQMLAKKLSCSTTSSQELIDCLRTKSAVEIATAQTDSSKFINMILPNFVPVIEKKGTANAFLTEDPEIMLKEGRFHKGLSIISGVNRDEMAIFIQPIYDYFNNGKYDEHFLDNHMQNTVSLILGFNSTEAFQRILAEYFLDVDLKDEEEFKRAAITASSDGFFKAPNDASVRYMSKHLTTYMYTFEYRGSTWLGGFLRNNDKTSCGHADDLLYLFDGTGNLKGTDLAVSQNFVNLWTNFAIQGDPTPSQSEVEWKPSSPNEIRYLRIADTLTMHQGYRTEQMKFWNEDMKEFKTLD